MQTETLFKQQDAGERVDLPDGHDVPSRSITETMVTVRKTRCLYRTFTSDSHHQTLAKKASTSSYHENMILKHNC